MSYTKEQLLEMGVPDSTEQSPEDKQKTDEIEKRLGALNKEMIESMVTPRPRVPLIAPSTQEDAATIEQWVGEDFDRACHCPYPTKRLLYCLDCLRELARAVARARVVGTRT